MSNCTETLTETVAMLVIIQLRRPLKLFIEKRPETATGKND